MKDLDTAEVARLTGVPASTLRYYEERGVIASIGRRGQRRLFDPDILDRLAFIALAQAAGFSLEEVAALFAPGGTPRVNRAALSAKADDLDRAIRHLSALRDGLRHAARCPEEDHFACPTFQRLLKAAAGRRPRPPLQNVRAPSGVEKRETRAKTRHQR